MKLPLKKLRETKDITQAEFSKVMDVAPSTIGLWEQGRREPNYNILNKIADYFGVSVDYLLGREKPAESTEENLLVMTYRQLNENNRRASLDMMNGLLAGQK